MRFLANIFTEIWTNFYNGIIRNPSSEVKGAVILVLFSGLLLSLIFALLGGQKGEAVGNWFMFWLSVLFAVLSVLYISI